jgi:hypothetical protein
MMYDEKNSVSDVANYSTKAKNIRAVIDENVKALSKNSAIDPAKLRKWAYAGAFLKYDPQGNVVGVKPTQEIDDSADYVSNLIQNAPEKIYTGAQSLYDALPKLNNEEVGKVYKRRDKSGKLTDTEYSGKLYEHQELYEDPETGEYRSRVKGKDITFSDGTKGRGLSDDAYNRIFGSGDNQIVLNAEFNKRFKDAIQSGEIKNEDVPALKSAFALQMVENSKVGGIKNKDIVQERMPSIRVYNNNGSGSTTDDNANPLVMTMRGYNAALNGGKGAGSEFIGQYKGDKVNTVNGKKDVSTVRINVGANIVGPNGEKYEKITVDPNTGDLFAFYKQEGTTGDGDKVTRQRVHQIEAGAVEGWFMERLHTNNVTGGKARVKEILTSKKVAQNTQQPKQQNKSTNSDPLGLGL